MPVTNIDRANAAAAALNTFNAHMPTDVQDLVSDLICSLGHLCAIRPEFGGFDDNVRRAREALETELWEDLPPAVRSMLLALIRVSSLHPEDTKLVEVIQVREALAEARKAGLCL